MMIKIETMTTTDGSKVHDLVLVQGADAIRLGLIADDAEQAVRELVTWLEDNTMDLVEVMRAKKGVAA